MRTALMISMMFTVLFYSVGYAEAQSSVEYKATIYGDAGLNFSGSAIEIEETDMDSFSVDLDFGGGYLFHDMFELGGMAILGYDSSEIDYQAPSLSDIESSTFSFEIGPYAFFHFYRTEKVRLYFGPAVTLIFSTFEQEEPGDYEEDGFGFGIYGVVGSSFFLTRNLAVTLSGNVGYNTIEYDVDGLVDEIDADGIGYALGLGLKYYFERK